MEVRIAVTKEEAGSWTGTAVVIDVIRFSTTVAALAAAGRKTVRVYGSAERLKRDLGRFPDADIFSELDLAPEIPPFPASWKGYRRFDNSPTSARDPAGAERTALCATTSGSKAAAACQRARTVIIGSFPNFTAATEAMRATGDGVLLVPAALWLSTPKGKGQWIEDTECAAAFQEALAGTPDPGRHLGTIWASERPSQFRSYRPEDRDRDLSLCLTLDAFQTAPRIRLEGDVGIVEN